ncbi:MAG: RluA family pseudouridine synthase [Acidimicrobiales bacterium]
MSDDHVLDVALPEGLDGWRADRALAMLSGLSRREAAALIDAGALSVNGVVVTRAAAPLDARARLEARLPERGVVGVEPDASVVVTVALEDPDFVVIDKAPGVVVHPGAGHRGATLIAGVLARYPAMLASLDGLGDPERPGVVHRLDKGTSGLLVVATSPAGFAGLAAQMRAHLARRTYLALVEGTVAADAGVVDAPIGRSTRTPTRMSVRVDGRDARTRYEVVGRLDGPPATTLVRVGLETGRTHQIRVHLASIGHPVVNDTRYGHRRDRRLGEDRPFLHAARLEFAHPLTGERVDVSSALPDDLAALVPGLA